jgi:hypothetical protein
MRRELITLPLTLLQNQSVWNIVRVAIRTTNYEVVNETLKVYYPKGSYSPSKMPQGGVGFFASPKNIFPSEEVTLKYQVYFNETFNPVYGGKLPGLFLGVGARRKDFTGASGGRQANNSASIRMAWRENMIGEVYLYVPREVQSNEYEKLQGFVRNGKYGDSVWRGAFKFEKGVWNNVTIRAKLNDVNESKNGELEVEINGVNERYNKMVWRTSERLHITAILFESFFGGSTEKYATPVDTYTYFRNVQIR